MNLASEYLLRNGHYARGQCGALAEHIVFKYQKSFQDQVGNVVYGAGYLSLRQSIYNNVNHRKQESEKKKKKNVKRLAVDSDGKEETRRIKEQTRLRKADKYGCVDFLPIINEDANMQKTKQSRLCELFA